MIRFIDDHRGAYGVEPICKLLPIAPSTYHAQAARRSDPARLPARARRDVVLATDIQRVGFTRFCGHCYAAEAADWNAAAFCSGVR